MRRKELAVPGTADRPGYERAPDQRDANDMPGRLRLPSPPQGPDNAEEARPADQAWATDERVPWSRADLAERLERLPPGHPSSPRTVDVAINRLADASDWEPDAVKRNYWTEVPRFLRVWADHVRRWPAERVTTIADRSRDPEGSWRGDGGQYLAPEQLAQAKDVIATVQQKEKIVTGHMTDTERENSCGGWLVGLRFARKGEERLKEKIADELGITPAIKPEDAINKLNDVIRYTFCFESADYAAGYSDVRQRLEAREYRMVYSKNHWRDDPEYKGINTRWVTPEGQRFEVQFHTAESYHAKHEVTHSSYERIRNRLTSDDERGELEAFQQEVSGWIPIPEGAREIPDYRMRGR
jgi:hypothetical protein